MNQQFDNRVLNLVKQNGFYPYEYIDSSKTIEKSKERLLSKDKFYSSLIGKGISMKMFLNTETNLEWKYGKLSRFVFKMWCFVFSWCISII